MQIRLDLKARLILTYGIFVIVAATVAFAAYYYFVLPGYVLIEQQDATHHIERLVGSIDKEVVNLDRFVRDYAFWDDTCDFVATGDPAYLESNFLDEMFIDNHLSSVVIYNASGQLLYSKGYDLANKLERPLYVSMYGDALVGAGHGLIRSISGLTLNSDGLQMVAARSIMASDGQGTAHGTMIFTRPLDSVMVNDLSRQYRLDIGISPLTNRTGDAERLLLNQLTKTSPILIQVAQGDKLNIYTKLKDIDQHDIALVKINLPRKLYTHTHQIMMTALGFALGSILLLALLLGVAVRRMVLRPFRELSNVVHMFRKNCDVRLPATLAKDSDLGGLVQEFNYLLTDLEESRLHLNFSVEETDLIKRVVPSAIFTVDKNKVITGWNERAEKITGYSAAEMIGSTCFLFAQKPCQETCGLFDDQMCKPITGRECTIRHKDGSVLTISKNADFLLDAQGEVVGGIECFEDITTRKRSEEALQWEVALNSRLAKLSHSIIHNADNVREVACELLGYARNITGSMHGFVAEVDDHGQQVLWEHTDLFSGLESEGGLPIIAAPASGRGSLLHTMYKRQTGVYFNSLERLSIVNLADGITDKVTHFMAVPVSDSEKIIGQVALANNENGYTKRDLQAIEQLAELFSVVLSQPYQQARRQGPRVVKGLEVCQQ